MNDNDVGCWMWCYDDGNGDV